MTARGPARPTRDDIAVLVAMLTRSKPLVAKSPATWFVPDWGHPDLGRAVIDRLEAAKLIEPGRRHGVRVLTEAGRIAALNACSAPGRGTGPSPAEARA